MNVTELARKLNITTGQLFDEIEKLGFDVGRRAIKVDDRVAAKILEALQGKVKRKKILTDKEEESQEEEAEQTKAIEEEGTILLPPRIVIKDFAQKLKTPVTEVLTALMKNGVPLAMNEEIDHEIAAIIAEDFGFKVRLEKSKDMEEKRALEISQNLEEILKGEKKSRLVPRPPVVVVMGHVDHGKTKLLDAIRKTNIVEKEAGGITQHIGAYQVEERGKLITFIDTPGHEAFMAMRSRGAQVADIAILVIAADDGMRPQTIEALNTIQAAKLPFVVAINKIDKSGADIEKIKKELSELNLLPEDWGGKIITVPVSAKEGKGITELLDMVLLVADLEKDKISANPEREAVGTIIESHVDKGEGPVATILVQTGTLKKGDLVNIGGMPGKIRTLKDFRNNILSQAGPSMPVKILGLKDLSEVGEMIEVVKDIKSLKKKMKKYQAASRKRLLLDDKLIKKNKIREGGALKIILRTDTLGSQEAIFEALDGLKHPEVSIQILKKELGNITAVDVEEAAASGALIIGFGVKVKSKATIISQEKGVEIKIFDVIYDLIDEVKMRLEKLLEPEIILIPTGEVRISRIFSANKNRMILGGKVGKGQIKKGMRARVLRDRKEIGRGEIMGLQQQRAEVNTVDKGNECGVDFKCNFTIERGDVIEIFEEQKKERKLENLYAYPSAKTS